jgi:hypothetical protein
MIEIFATAEAVSDGGIPRFASTPTDNKILIN